MRLPNFKRANEVSEYRPENIVDLQRCMNDPVFFMENYVKVRHPKKGLVPLILYPYQKRMVDALVNHKDIIMLCSRQLGKCSHRSTKLLNSIVKPTGFRKYLLRLLDRNLHDSIFRNSIEKEGT